MMGCLCSDVLNGHQAAVGNDTSVSHMHMEASKMHANCTCSDLIESESLLRHCVFPSMLCVLVIAGLRNDTPHFAIYSNKRHSFISLHFC